MIPDVRDLVADHPPPSWAPAVFMAIVVHAAMIAVPLELEPPPKAKKAPAQVVKIQFAPTKAPEAPIEEVAPPPPPPPPPKPAPRAIPKPPPKEKKPPKSDVPAPPPPSPDPPPPPPTPVAAPPPPARPPPPPPPPPPKVDFGAYNRGVFKSIVGQKRYPRAARKLGLQGRVIVIVAIKKDGTLARPPRVHTSSGHEILDEEAKRAAGAAAPYPRLPEGFRGRTREIAIPVLFRLK